MAAGYPNGVPLTDLVRRAGESDGVDLVYVDDNYGYFSAEFSALVGSALDGAWPDLVKPIVPPEGNRVLTKVSHSAFYPRPSPTSTPIWGRRR